MSFYKDYTQISDTHESTATVLAFLCFVARIVANIQVLL